MPIYLYKCYKCGIEVRLCTSFSPEDIVGLCDNCLLKIDKEQNTEPLLKVGDLKWKELL